MTTLSFIRPAFMALVIMGSAYAHTAVLDAIRFGDVESESTHAFSAKGSDTIRGGLDTPARRLLPAEPSSWAGGTLQFELKTDPSAQNYLTVRLWGSDVSHNLLMLHLDGKQIGYRHLGDYDCLDTGADAPAYNGRFYYKTLPLPLALTQGKTHAQLEIRSNGPIWGYGKNFAEYQKPMVEPSRGIYAAYTHTDGCFVPPSNEKEGNYPKEARVRNVPGEEVLESVKARVNGEINSLLKPGRVPNQMQALFLAKAYRVKWTEASAKPVTIERILAALDQLYRVYRKNPELAQAEPSTYNPDWFGLGPSGQVVALLTKEFGARLDEKIDDGSGAQISRRDAFTDMLVACRDWHRAHRRQYTNQSMINDLYGIYLANRGVAVLTPKKAMPEKECLRYLRESVGLEPWLGSEIDGKPTRPLGDHFYQLTAKGLSRELGFVGNYGEITDWACQIYEGTRPSPDQPGDAELKAQLVKIARARAPFRYPMLDQDGFRAMVQETVVGWRDTHFPGNITYAQRPTWDGSSLEAAAITLDSHLVGYSQQMLADNQFFSSIARQLESKGFRTTFGLLQVPEQHETIKAQAPSKHRLPMSWNQPDFVFTDEDDGVVAIKHGNEILYASLYWRARYAVNFLARVHYLTPSFDRVAVVRQETLYSASGMEYTRPNWTNFGFGNGGHRYPADIVSAHTGEKLPIAKIPNGIVFKPGNESIHAGRGDFYQLRYGPYFIAMNLSTDKTFDVKVPADSGPAAELVSKTSNISPGVTFSIPPHTTKVFRFTHSVSN